MMEQNDWRMILPWHEEALSGVTLIPQTWKLIGNNDHDHCAFCWDKFADYDGCLHQGYTTEDRSHWICEQCFNDFKARFGWEAISIDS